jgi:predicted TPR repeat methyltransferase
MNSSQKYYDELDAEYENQSKAKKAYIEAIDDLILDFFRYRQLENWLDIGTGDGLRFLKLRKRLSINENALSLVEPSINLFVLAKKRMPKVRIYNQDYLSIQEQSSKYKLITALWNVLGHLEDRVQFIQKVHRELSNEGVFIFDVNNRYNIKQYGLYSVAVNFCKSILGARSSGWFELRSGKVITHVYIHTKAEVVDLLHKNGFKLVKMSYVDYETGKIQRSKFLGQIFVIAKKLDQGD